jgi:tetratricopeptide (TPR) repeat protein
MKITSNSIKFLFTITIIGFQYLGFSQNAKAIQAFSKSYEFEKNKDYSNSIAVLKDAYDSTSYEMNLRLGWLNYSAGFNKSALGYYQTAVSKMPNSEEAKIGYNCPAFALGNWDNVIAQYKKILDVNPGNTSVCYNLGLIYYNKSDFKTAATYFQKIIDLYPFDYDGLLMSAWTNFKLGNKQLSKEQFDKVLLYSPSDKSALEGITYVGDDEKKNVALETAFSKSYVSSQSGDYIGAINALKPVYDKASYEINLRLGYLSYLAGQNKESMAYYKLAIDLKPKALEPRFGYVYPAAAFGQTDELIAQYTTILQIDPQNTIANYRQGYIFYQKKDYTAAYKYFNKVVALYPFAYEGLVMYAKASLQLGNKEEAKKLFNQVLLLSASDKDAISALASLK